MYAQTGAPAHTTYPQTSYPHTTVPVEVAPVAVVPVQPPIHEHHLPLRAVVFITVALICAGLDIAGVVSTVMTVDTNRNQSHTTLWRSCTTTNSIGNNGNNFNNNNVNNNGGGTSCANADDVYNDCTMDVFKAMRAFGIMSIIVALLFCVPAGVADLRGVFRTVAMARSVLLALAVLLMILQLIFWALFVGLWKQGCSGQMELEDVAGSGYGPSVPLFIVSWVLSLLLIPMVISLPGAVVEPAAMTGATMGGMPVRTTHHVPIRAAVFLTLVIICGALDIAGVTTDILKVDNNSNQSHSTLWRSSRRR